MPGLRLATPHNGLTDPNPAMKKLLLAITAVIVIAAIGASAWFYLLPDRVARRAIEHYGSEAIQASVRVDRVQISSADGSGLITGFSVSNPTGFRTPTAITAASIKMTVEFATLDRDAVVVRTLSVAAPQITYEWSQAGSNFAALLENLQHQADKPSKKIVVDRVLIHNAKLSYPSATDAGQTITVDLPDIRLSSIGRIKGGATSKEFATAIVEVLLYHIKRKIPDSALQGGPRAGK